MEMKILAIKNRIELLNSRTQKDNGRVIAKLQRKLNKLKKMENGVDE